MNRHVHETSLFSELPTYLGSNSHEVIARSYYDETLPKSTERTLIVVLVSSCKTQMYH